MSEAIQQVPGSLLMVTLKVIWILRHSSESKWILKIWSLIKSGKSNVFRKCFWGKSWVESKSKAMGSPSMYSFILSTVQELVSEIV